MKDTHIQTDTQVVVAVVVVAAAAAAGITHGVHAITMFVARPSHPLLLLLLFLARSLPPLQVPPMRSVQLSPPLVSLTQCKQLLVSLQEGKRLENDWDDRVMKHLLLNPPPSDAVLAAQARVAAGGLMDPTHPARRCVAGCRAACPCRPNGAHCLCLLGFWLVVHITR